VPPYFDFVDRLQFFSSLMSRVFTGTALLHWFLEAVIVYERVEHIQVLQISPFDLTLPFIRKS
jgi:hypothetical protein